MLAIYHVCNAIYLYEIYNSITIAMICYNYITPFYRERDRDRQKEGRERSFFSDSLKLNSRDTVTNTRPKKITYQVKQWKAFYKLTLLCNENSFNKYYCLEVYKKYLNINSTYFDWKEKRMGFLKNSVFK